MDAAIEVRGLTKSYGSFEAVENLVVRVQTESGLTGWGCAAPDGQVTGETVEGNLDALREVLFPALHQPGESTVEELLRKVGEAAPEEALLLLAEHGLDDSFPIRVLK